MQAYRYVLVALAGTAVLAGCNFSGKILDNRSVEEQRMVFPSDPPIDGVFVAIRGSGDEIAVPSEQPTDETRPPRIIARPIAPAAGGEAIDRTPPVFIEPGEGDLPLPLPPNALPPTSQPRD